MKKVPVVRGIRVAGLEGVGTHENATATNNVSLLMTDAWLW
jgi:hypothetical protein